MRFGVFLPPQAQAHAVPVSTGFRASPARRRISSSSRAQRVAGSWAGHRGPDTSPRGLNSRRRRELRFRRGRRIFTSTPRKRLVARLPMYSSHEGNCRAGRVHVSHRCRAHGIFGHHGRARALTIALRTRPITSRCRPLPDCGDALPWEKRHWKAYIGADRAPGGTTTRPPDRGPRWKGPRSGRSGTETSFCRPAQAQSAKGAARRAGVSLDLRLQAGTDHSYFSSKLHRDHPSISRANLSDH